MSIAVGVLAFCHKKRKREFQKQALQLGNNDVIISIYQTFLFVISFTVTSLSHFLLFLCILWKNESTFKKDIKQVLHCCYQSNMVLHNRLHKYRTLVTSGK